MYYKWGVAYCFVVGYNLAFVVYLRFLNFYF